MAPSSSDERLGYELLTAALDGELQKVKQVAKKLGNGKGLRKACERFRDETGRTALHWAAVGGSTHICKFLIEKLKMNVDIKDLHGRTPLIHAIIHDHPSTMDYLIDKGANINQINKMGETAMHCAVEKGNIELLKLLVYRGADINAVSVYGTPLQYAAQIANKEAVNMLIYNNANVDAGLQGSSSPLLLAIGAKSIDCMELLLRGGANTNFGAFGYNMPPLCRAASTGETKIINHLLKNRADPDVVDVFGLSPLEEATKVGDFNGAIELLLVTTPFPWLPEWTLDGIVKHVHSQEAWDKRELKRKEVFQERKSKGEDALKAKNYWIAINWFSLALEIDRKDAIVHSDLSLCWACLDSGKHALSEARICVSLSPEWSKAHFREGVAWKLLKNYHKAAEAFQQALKLDPDDKEVQEEFRKATEAADAGDAYNWIILSATSSTIAEMLRS